MLKTNLRDSLLHITGFCQIFIYFLSRTYLLLSTFHLLLHLDNIDKHLTNSSYYWAVITFSSLAISSLERLGSMPKRRRSSSVSLLRSIFFLPAFSLSWPFSSTSKYWPSSESALPGGQQTLSSVLSVMKYKMAFSSIFDLFCCFLDFLFWLVWFVLVGLVTLVFDFSVSSLRVLGLVFVLSFAHSSYLSFVPSPFNIYIPFRLLPMFKMLQVSIG